MRVFKTFFCASCEQRISGKPNISRVGKYRVCDKCKDDMTTEFCANCGDICHPDCLSGNGICSLCEEG